MIEVPLEGAPRDIEPVGDGRGTGRPPFEYLEQDVAGRFAPEDGDRFPLGRIELGGK